MTIDLLLNLLPYAYPHTASHVRPLVEVRHAWYAEHKNPLGSFSEFRFIEAMTPIKNENSDKPSTSWSDYEPLPTSLPDDLKEKVHNFCDLCVSLPDWSSTTNVNSTCS
jgi:CRISPR-associated protein Csd2